jgi:hypothetical protein
MAQIFEIYAVFRPPSSNFAGFRALPQLTRRDRSLQAFARS